MNLLEQFTKLATRKTIQPVSSSSSSENSGNSVIGKSVNSTKAPVLDWRTFDKNILQPMFIGNNFDPKARGAYSQQLGLDLGGDSGVMVGDMRNGMSYIDKNYGDDATNNYTRLLTEAKKAGVDISKYKLENRTESIDGTYVTQNENEYTRLNNDVVKTNIAAKLKDPNTIYTVLGDRINSDGTTTGGKTKTNVQYKRVGDKLVPVGRQDYEETGATEALLKEGLPFLLSSMAPALAGPLGGALGLTGTTGAVAGGAVLGGVNSALTGQNILKGTVAGGIGGYGGALGKTFAEMGLNPILAQSLGRGLTSAGSVAVKGGDPLSGLVMGAIPGINTGNPGLSLVLNTLLRNSIGKSLAKRG